MEPVRRNLLLLSAIAVLTFGWPPCLGQSGDSGEAAKGDPKAEEDSIWQEDRPGGRRRHHAQEEITDRVLEEMRKNDPETAKRLAKLREEDPEKFQEELRKHGQEYFDKVVRAYMEARRKRWQEEFLEWYSENYSDQAKELGELRESDPEVYTEKLEFVMRKYRHIYETSRRNPPLGQVLREDLALREQRDEYLTKIKSSESESKKRELKQKLEEVVARRFDLIVRRKQIAYEELLEKLEELKEKIKEGRDELLKARDRTYKEENVKERMKSLLSEPGFRWD